MDEIYRMNSDGSGLTALARNEAGKGCTAEAEPQKAKALLRLLIEELRVNSRAQIVSTYRVVTDTVCATYGAYRDRTGDLRLAKPALSQLS